MTLITTLSDCTSEGRQFTDDVNDFSLEIPEGAIPEGERLTIDVGVALFGPFQFPEGLRPVSPVFWVCVRDNSNFQFSKPVTITIPHFLHLENDEDIQSLGLTFLKADHNEDYDGLHEFQLTDGEMDFKSVKTHAILKTTHFCYDCIAAKDIPTILEKSWFCITAVLPEYYVPVAGRVNAYFFITFLNLKTCLKCVENIISKMGLERHKVERENFRFKSGTRDPSLKMICTHPNHGHIGVRGKNKVNLTLILYKPKYTNKLIQIFRSDVDFFVKRGLSQRELECLRSDEFYPPRFKVFFASLQKNAILSGGKIAFRGATTPVEFGIHLPPDPLVSPATFPCTSVFNLLQLIETPVCIFTAVSDARRSESHQLLGIMQALINSMHCVVKSHYFLSY